MAYHWTAEEYLDFAERDSFLYCCFVLQNIQASDSPSSRRASDEAGRNVRHSCFRYVQDQQVAAADSSEEKAVITLKIWMTRVLNRGSSDQFFSPIVRILRVQLILTAPQPSIGSEISFAIFQAKKKSSVSGGPGQLIVEEFHRFFSHDCIELAISITGFLSRTVSRQNMEVKVRGQGAEVWPLSKPV
jgi:hypothetical protein